MATSQDTTPAVSLVRHETILVLIEIVQRELQGGNTTGASGVLAELEARVRRHLATTERQRRESKERKRGQIRPPVAEQKPWTKEQRREGRQLRERLKKYQKDDRAPKGLDALAVAIGYASYKKYIASDHWRELKEWHAHVWGDRGCLGCGLSEFQLHHITYNRIGQEKIEDVLPFCEKCHSLLHRAHRKERIPTENYKRAMTIAFNWSPAEIARRLEPYYALAE